MQHLIPKDFCEKCGNSGIIIRGSQGKFDHVLCDNPIHQQQQKGTTLAPKELTAEWLQRYIPNPSYHADFDTRILDHELPLYIQQATDYKLYKQHLNTFIEKMKEGILPSHSYFISAPKGTPNCST